MPTRLLIRNARVLDVAAGDYIVGCSVLVEDGRITEVGSGVTASGADSLDAADRVVMPGLIDAHVHPMISSVHIGSLAAQPVTLLAQRARVALEGMLRRGFTTVRDACGADAGLVRAVEEGLINGPRLFASGRALSQTGGHGDSRTLADQCAGHTDQFSRIADGVDAVRLAARSELRAGAHQIKVMASGGVASPSDEIWTLQYSLEELRAAVEEAVARRTYVLAHAYTAEAVERAVMSGVKSIEHGNLIDAPTAALMARHGTFLVPTLVTYEQLRASGEDYGMPPDQLRKVGDVIDAGLDSVRLARAAGVKVGFGTDLLGELQVHQSDEFRIRSRGEDPIDIIRSATVVNAELVGLAQRAGVVAAGADADLVLVDGDPLGTVTHLAEPERVACVIRSGVVAFSRTG